MSETAAQHPGGTEQILGAVISRHRPIAIKPVQTTVEFQLSLTPERAHAFYNELYRLQRACGFPNNDGWREAYPELFDLYDGLNNAGVDGTGP